MGCYKKWVAGKLLTKMLKYNTPQLRQNRMGEINDKAIEGCLIDKTTARGMEQLAEWLAVLEENQKKLFEMGLAFHLGKNNSFATSEKIEETGTKLFNQITGYKEQNRGKNKLCFLRYAAAIIVTMLLTRGGFFAYLHQSTETVTVVAVNEVKKVVSPGDSAVRPNKGATISCANNFEGGERKVNPRGEALFHITKNAAKPLIVNSDRASAKVLGTTFNFKDQAINGKEVISLVEGRLGIIRLNGEGKVALHPNQKVTVSKDSEAIKTENSYTLVDAVWRGDVTPFNNTRISEIAEILKQLYSYKIIVGAGLDHIKVYTNIIERNKDTRNVLDGFSYTISFHYTIRDREMTFSE